MVIERSYFAASGTHGVGNKSINAPFCMVDSANPNGSKQPSFECIAPGVFGPLTRNSPGSCRKPSQPR